MHFLVELRARCSAWKASLRSRRDYAGVLQVEVAEDIVGDIAAEQRRVGQSAYSAEQDDLEARQLLEAAQRPDSPGGVNITPAELAPALRHIGNSARKDREISEALHA